MSTKQTVQLPVWRGLFLPKQQKGRGQNTDPNSYCLKQHILLRGSKMVDAVPLQSDFGRYIIHDGAKTRRRERREDKRRLACEEAVTKSRLSYHMVKFEFYIVAF